MRYLLVFLCCLLPLRGQWDANGFAQLKLRTYTDVVDGGPSIFSRRVVVDRFDRIVAVRLGRRVPDSVFSIVLERVLPNGEHDPSFGDQGVAVIPFGTVQHDRLHGVFVDSMGAIVVVANVGPTPFFARVHANGRLDTTYGTDGFVRLDPTFTCGEENGVAVGHNVSLACSKVVDDTTTRCLLVHVSDRGVVKYEPFVSSRCDRFMVYHHGEQFLASGRTIIKLDTNGLIDTTFGSFGSVRWRHLGGEAYTHDLELYDDTTIVALTLEFTPGTSDVECEYTVRYLDVHSGMQVDSIVIPFSYYDDPRLSLLFISVGSNGALAVAGSYRGQSEKTYPTLFRFTDRNRPDQAFYGTGQLNVTLPYESVVMDIASLSSTQQIAFLSPSLIARFGDAVTTVAENVLMQPLSVFPNPISDHFTIRTPFPSQGIRYEIVSMLGAIVQEGFTGSSSDVEIGKTVMRGMYYLRVHQSQNVVVGVLLNVE